jgi:hypothetical protein
MFMADSLRPPGLEFMNTPGYSMMVYSPGAYETEPTDRRAFRYEKIPFWQVTGARTSEYDAQYQNSELENKTRGWDISRLWRTD